MIVSNHGGRQLDTALPAIRALPGVVEAVAGRIPVLLDGGVRRGSHVVKAVALGATACLIGRPHLWGLAVAGEAGVAQVLEIFGATSTGCWRSAAGTASPRSTAARSCRRWRRRDPVLAGNRQQAELRSPRRVVAAS